VGTVAEMLRKRDRRDTRKRFSWSELLWLLLVVTAFLAGAELLPAARSPWLAALLRVGLGSLIALLLAAAARLAPRTLEKPAVVINYALMMTVFVSVQALFPERLWPDEGVRVLVGSAVAGVLTGVVLGLSRWLARRREQRIREAEVARLASRF